MKKTPCEVIVWDVLPCIRRELAKSMADLGLNETKIADKIGVTIAAVSQYLSNKRGTVTSFDEDIRREIKKSARNIIDGEDAVKEICRICSLVKVKDGIDIPCGI
ncbi:MAG: transcriptional regulator [Thermoplasmata archaeon]|nr:transcriptional regulator [Thermoplasmata archaeon]